MSLYLLSICYPAGAVRPPAAELDRIVQGLGGLRREMHDAGVWVFAGGLEPPASSSVVRAEDGQVLVTDGPFIESKELIGGICVIRVATLDEARAWAARMSRATTTPVEVRPIQQHHP